MLRWRYKQMEDAEMKIQANGDAEILNPRLQNPIGP
jgi:hypothetical protein